MFFDVEQALEALAETERPRPAPRPGVLLPLAVGILIGRKLPR